MIEIRHDNERILFDLDQETREILWRTVAWNEAGWSGLGWAESMTSDDTERVINLRFYDEEYALRVVRITEYALLCAYIVATEMNVTHCGGYRIDDLDDPDECTVDWLIQQAAFGVQVFG